MTNPVCYLLVGLPGSGKSTFVRSKVREMDATVLSTDDAIERYALVMGKTYNEVFSETIKGATAYLDDCLDTAIALDNSIIWDQTNLSKKTRARNLARVPKHYEKIAVVFQVDDEELDRRLRSRPGKTIPDHVIKSMKENFVYPTEDEGFDKILKFNENFS